MKLIFFLFVFLSTLVWGIDVDFDGVEDDVDACLNTAMLELVDAKGCSKSQLQSTKQSFQATLLQTYSYLTMEEQSSLDNYSLAVMLNGDDWLLYVGSGYFKYDTSSSSEKSLGDTTLFVQKTFMLSSQHYLKSSLFMTLPTYNSEGNNLDYGADMGYMFLYNKISFELDYQYTLIQDDNIDNLGLFSTYIGYNFDKFTGLLGYSYDSESRENYNFIVQYKLSKMLSLSYTFSEANNNFYNRMHSVGLGYIF